ncbi:transporter substrate-binding domain-containing protein [Pseudomonas extremaustralis]|uniref:histidine kinase n=1 Tax=Pseudomonas extremaustralis TaxID=359110 RepID=A0A5C5Q8H0_9PSED|nr:transporter substrate-binding domain-containing protein [Pseudomonas extremaustralis]EZI26830.1 histidine kinase [Pseudomonas extremaustralis 14-3 substr. 14-3b]TWS02077.1 transporter substrate-binding domain-containing protein [Pseudomonas extremaustralis]SDF24656.1 two-component system, NarL family, sensor histidine kinase EvgS [Pseudomonas extremaustralis]
MNPCRLITFAAIVLMGLLPSAVMALDEPHTLRLLGHSTLDHVAVRLDEADWGWLREHRTLSLGVSAPDYAPFDLSNNKDELEGITADYAALIAQLLNIAIEVRRYDTRDEVIEALKSGAVDFVGSANGYEAADPQLVLSRSYANDQPTLVTRAGDSHALSADLAGKRVAMLYHYMQPDAVQAFYPDAHLLLFGSTFEAIGAVAFGQADVYLGDAISARYLINKNHLNNVRMADFSALEVNPFGFAFVKDNVRLLNIINAALAAVPVNQQMEILRRWSAGGSGFLEADRLRLSDSEQRWLEKHPRVKVAAVDKFVPLSFSNEQGQFEGLSAEVLSRISLRTGLRFDVEQGSSLPRQIDEVSSGRVDMLASVIPSIERSEKIRFTRPYLSNPYVLVVAADNDRLITLEDMPGKRLALINGNNLIMEIIRDFPGIGFVDVENPEQALDLVAKGSVDATVVPLISARYMIARHYRGRLRITSTVGREPARITFGVNRSQLELYSILDKALLSISPEEMDELTNHWRSEIIIEDSYWARHRNVIIQGFGLAALLLLVTLGWVFYLRNLIRKRAQAERALSDQMRFMSVLIDGTPHPIYVRDRQGRLMACNNAYLDVFGFKLEDVIGKTVVETDTGNPPQAQSFHADYLRLMEQGEPQIHDRVLKVPGGGVMTIYQWMLPYRDSNGNVVGMIAGWVDVSERQRLLGQLQEAKEEADAANRAKTTFLATMSHEIRTPMNAVIGMIELALKNAEQGQVDRDALEVASVASRSMLELIGDILDIARIESGHLSLSLEPANLYELLASVGRVFEGLARDKGLALQVELDPLIDRVVLIDPLRFKQVVSNLLGNAIKFTATGQVRLGAEGALADDQLSLRLWVEDTGIGISADDQLRLFNPFIQGSNNEQSARSGSGLGLVISRNLCEMMGGRLHLSSVLGKGTRVDVTLTLATSTAMPVTSAVPHIPPARALNILVVDDYPANRLLLARQLGFLGHRITTAEDGAQGFALWQAGHFDGVITDCNMPLKDGYTLARDIRAQERLHGLTPCLLLGFTANAQPQETERCRQAGMDGCLFKPTGLDDLRAALAPRTANRLADDAEPAFDVSSLIALTEGDKAALNELLLPLLSSLKEDRAVLRAQQGQVDFAALHDLAHRVKGGARMVKATTLITCSETLEGVCERRDSAAVGAAVEALGAAIDHLHQSLERYCRQA